MISMLSTVLDMDITDGVLSVLPMHHTFEFSAGISDAVLERNADHISERTDGGRPRPARSRTAT